MQLGSTRFLDRFKKNGGQVVVCSLIFVAFVVPLFLGTVYLFRSTLVKISEVNRFDLKALRDVKKVIVEMKCREKMYKTYKNFSDGDIEVGVELVCKGGRFEAQLTTPTK